MAGIEWSLFLYRTATPEDLVLNTDADGNLRDSYLGASANPVTGTYDEASNALNFRTGGLRGEGVLYASFYSGYAIFDGDGNLFALAGTYQEHVIAIEPFGVDEELGGWYAIPNME
jgi:hypothetical protein